jgi:hypothetical protein
LPGGLSVVRSVSAMQVEMLIKVILIRAGMMR